MVDEDDEDRDLPVSKEEEESKRQKAQAAKDKGKRWEEPPKKVEKKVYGPPAQRQKNERGDYVVTKINVKDRVDENKFV